MSKVKTLKVEKEVTTTGTQEISNKDLLTISISGNSGINKFFILLKNITYDLLI